jgi:hypothetical protein
MPARCRLVSPFLALAIIPALAGRCPAQSYRDDQRHFSIELPTGWQVMTTSEIDQVNKLLGGRLIGTNIHYDGGLRKKTGQLGSLPYALIQAVSGPPTGASFEELEKTLSANMSAPIKEAQGRMADLVRDIKIGDRVLNRESKCIVFRTQSTVPGVGTVKGLSMGHLGRDNIVFIHCYAKAEDYDACAPTFRRINEWFSFDRGYDFKQGSGSAGLFSWHGAGRSGIVGGAIGLMVGLASFLFRIVSKSGTPRVIRPAD